MRVDCLQYAHWNEQVFREMRAGAVDAVHATLAYHGDFRALTRQVAAWNRRFAAFPDLIMMGSTATDIDVARASNRTAIFFGSQNPSVIEADLDLVEIACSLGLRFMQLSYNHQSLLACGYMEDDDTGLTRFGREVMHEMNRVGMVIDMSHSSDRATLEAVEASARPIAVTHANPRRWADLPRNKPDEVLAALADTGGMFGFSLYPLHLKGGSACTLEAFCAMAARTAERFGSACLGIGSDLCQGQPASALAWMRHGRWRRPPAEERHNPPAFPPNPPWFTSNCDFSNIEDGLRRIGFDAGEVAAIMGGNWHRFLADSLGAAR